MKTNFDRYLDEQLKDPAFVARFERAGEAWEVALQIAALRSEAGGAISRERWQATACPSSFWSGGTDCAQRGCACSQRV